MNQAFKDPEDLDQSEAGDESQKFIYKLVDRLGNPQVPQQAQVSNIREDNDLYLTPHMFESLMKEKNIIKVNPYKGDVFALGLIVLRCGLMMDLTDLYDLQNGTFKVDVLETLKEEFIKLYNDAILIELIGLLLDVNEETRLTPKKLLGKMDIILSNLDDGEEGEEEANIEQDYQEAIPDRIKSTSDSEESESESDSESESESESESDSESEFPSD